MTHAKGGCLCGALRYEVSAAPARTTVCHCRFCQQATGSAYMVQPVFSENDFSLVAGVARKYAHKSAGSGKQVYVHFCDACGTKLFLTFERFAGYVGVYSGTFDDPNWFDMTPENTKHIFLAAARNGTAIPPQINTFAEHAIGSDGAPAIPQVFETATVICQA